MTLDDAKKAAELQKLKLENLTAIFGLIAKVGAAMGTVSVFVYCFFIVKFFPVGLQVGDTLFFLFVVLGMAITGALVSGMGFITVVPWVLRPASASVLPQWRHGMYLACLTFCTVAVLYCARDYWAVEFGLQKARLRMPQGGSLGVGIFFVLVYFGLAWHLFKDLITAAGFFLAWLLITLVLAILMSPLANQAALTWTVAILAGGAFMAVGISALDNAGTSTHGAMPGLIILVAAMAVPFVFGEGGKMLGFVFHGVGIRADQGTLVVNGANQKILQAAADAKGLTLYTCRLEEDSHVISKVGILWHGIGQRSYVALQGKPAQAAGGKEAPAVEVDQLKVELDSAGVKKVEGTHEQSCLELRRAIYFDSGKATLRSAQWAVAQPVVRRFLSSYANEETEKGTNEKSLIVTGFADPMADAGKGNAMLARQRACTVYQALRADEEIKKLKTIEKLQVFVDSRIGSNDAACDGKNNAAGQRACHEKDRRVELQLVRSVSVFDRLGPVKANVCDTL